MGTSAPEVLKWFHSISTWQQMLHTHHRKYVIISFKNPTDIIRNNEEQMVYYTHDPRTEILYWFSYNLAAEYQFYPAEWVMFKDRMCTLNHRNYAKIPVMIAADSFANPQHLISERLYDNLLALIPIQDKEEETQNKITKRDRTYRT